MAVAINTAEERPGLIAADIPEASESRNVPPDDLPMLKKIPMVTRNRFIEFLMEFLIR